MNKLFRLFDSHLFQAIYWLVGFVAVLIYLEFCFGDISLSEIPEEILAYCLFSGVGAAFLILSFEWFVCWFADRKKKRFDSKEEK